MFKLTIKKPDDSIYWEERFKTMDAANVWIAEEQTRPYYDPKFTFTIEEITSDSPLTYADLRARAYPSIAEYLDGIVKGDVVQVQSYINACLAVKAKYPKS